MEIICDTNIWYSLGNNRIDKSLIQDEDLLIATFISLDELSFSENLLKYFENTQEAIRAMFKYSSKHPILEPPFAYLKVMDDEDFKYNIHDNCGTIIEFTERIASEHSVSINEIEGFEADVKMRKQSFKEVADLFNEHVQTNIRPNIKDTKSHRREDTISLNRDFINRLVMIQSHSPGLSDTFDWGQIELFEKVLKLFFNEVETGAKIIKQNDWFDLFLLIYVNPQRKIWTRDGYWKRLIKEAGLQKYLYEM